MYMCILAFDFSPSVLCTLEQKLTILLTQDNAAHKKVPTSANKNGMQ